METGGNPPGNHGVDHNGEVGQTRGGVSTGPTQADWAALASAVKAGGAGYLEAAYNQAHGTAMRGAE